MIYDKNGSPWNWTIESPVIQKLISEDDKRNAKVAAAVDAGDMDKAKQLCEDIATIEDVLNYVLRERDIPYQCEILGAQKRKELGLYTDLLGSWSPALVFYNDIDMDKEHVIQIEQIDDEQADTIVRAAQNVLHIDEIGLFTPKLMIAMEHFANWIGDAIDCTPISREYIQFSETYIRWTTNSYDEMSCHNELWKRCDDNIREKIREFANIGNA